MTTTIFPYNEAGHGNYTHRGTNCGPFATQADYYDSGNYWCETCDKGFQTAHQLEKHKRAHQKCNIDGCEFIAHPNIITKHIQMQHATGLYKKIAKLNDPEEIKKWREERKKKYPTKQNIEKKAAQIEEKVARGEKIGILDLKKNRKPHKPDYSVTKKQGSLYKNTAQRTYQNKNIHASRKKNKLPHKSEKTCNIILPTAEESRALKPFGGIQDLMYESDNGVNEEEVKRDDFIEEDEYVSETPPIDDNKRLETSETKVCGAITSLICNYGSSDEEGSDTEQIEAISNNEKRIELKTAVKDIQLSSMKPDIPNIDIAIPYESTDKTQNLSVEINKTDEIDDDSGPEETKIVKKESEEPQNSVNEKSSSLSKKDKMKLSVNMKNKTNFRNNTYRRKLPSTLLEKLLHKEIQKERNIVLQCIRYVVQNNYFKLK